MSAITVRGLPDEVHDGLRALATARGVSVESLVRTTLAEAITHRQAASGMGEAQQAWIGPAGSLDLATKSKPDLWGALRSTVHVLPATDLAAPLGEAWEVQV